MSFIHGSHMSIAKGFLTALKKTKEEYKASALQIFLKSPRGRMEKALDENEAKECKEYIKENKMFLIGHCSYLLNFAKDVSKDPWTLNSLISDLTKIRKLGGVGIVLHIGKLLDLDKEIAYKFLEKNIKEVLKRTEDTGSLILFENTAGQGTEIGFKLDELGYIRENLFENNKRIKFCLDTAHLFAAGYDLRTKNAVKDTFKEIEETLGLENVASIHLNDSKKDLGTRVDRHEVLGQGFIGKEGIKAVIKTATKNKIPLIIETPEKERTHIDDLVILREWAR